MTTVIKNQCQPCANAAPCAPRTGPADAEAFASWIKRKKQQESGEKKPAKKPCGPAPGQAKEAGPSPAKCAEKCAAKPPVPASTTPGGSIGNMVTGAMRELGQEVQQRAALGNTTLEDRSREGNKKLSMEQYATQFGQNFVDAIVDYRMKEFYGRTPECKDKPQPQPQPQQPAGEQACAPAVTQMPRTPVPANLAVKEPGVPTKTGIAALDRWDKQFAAASKSTGLPANYIKAVAWAQSRGDANAATRNPDGKHTDVGVMQISDYTYSDVMRNQPLAPRGLHASDPDDNIMMAAWELRDKFGTHGQNESYVKTSAAYRGVKDGRDTSYANAVIRFWSDINKGKKPSDTGPW